MTAAQSAELITVRGSASDEEIAAVLAVMAQQETPRELPSYDRWRAVRLAALRRPSPDGCATIVR